ncbi:MAG: N-6 DNA methylase, partial [Nitrospirae bacterium]|nr:N-6 DNA methylase [Nitrospirota bacterium]
NKVLFINGKDDVVDNKGQAYLTTEHIKKLYTAFKDFTDIPHFSKVSTIDDIMVFDGNLNINFYVKNGYDKEDKSFRFSLLRQEPLSGLNPQGRRENPSRYNGEAPPQTTHSGRTESSLYCMS